MNIRVALGCQKAPPGTSVYREDCRRVGKLSGHPAGSQPHTGQRGVP